MTHLAVFPPPPPAQSTNNSKFTDIVFDFREMLILRAPAENRERRMMTILGAGRKKKKNKKKEKGKRKMCNILPLLRGRRRRRHKKLSPLIPFPPLLYIMHASNGKSRDVCKGSFVHVTYLSPFSLNGSSSSFKGSPGVVVG